MIELNEDNLQSVIDEHKQVIVQYGATWCGNCRMIKPKFKKLAEATQGIAFVYVDAEKYPNSRKLAAVDNLPTFAAFKDGKLLKQDQGNKIDVVEGLVNEVTSH
ncbi:MAG TPA: thioredoxin family protein [Oligoflexia bacterium]|nr:thioredoxin family protein [Oligoflexia bacterium]HMR23718.1 thioredoxin family protein [Oligoflexia bacterium]